MQLRKAKSTAFEFATLKLIFNKLVFPLALLLKGKHNLVSCVNLELFIASSKHFKIENYTFLEAGKGSKADISPFIKCLSPFLVIHKTP